MLSVSSSGYLFKASQSNCFSVPTNYKFFGGTSPHLNVGKILAPRLIVDFPEFKRGSQRTSGAKSHPFRSKPDFH